MSARFQRGDRVKTNTQMGTVVNTIELQGDYQCHVRWDSVEMSWVWESYLAPADDRKEAAHGGGR